MRTSTWLQSSRSVLETRLLEIPLHQALQSHLAESWEEQHLTFAEGIEEIAFNAGYSPEKHERFRLPDYELPAWLSGENSQTIDHLDPITSDDELIDSIAGTVAMARNEQGRRASTVPEFHSLESNKTWWLPVP